MDKLRNAFTDVKPPISLNGCGCGSGLTETELRSLINSASAGTLRNHPKLRSYVLNVMRTVGSTEDFLYLVPSLLEVWADELHRTEDDDPFTSDFHRALTENDFLYQSVPTSLRTSIIAFFHTALLRKLGWETHLETRVCRNSAHSAFEYFSSYGQIADDIPSLWNDWWQLPSHGLTVATFEFGSCLAYEPHENPLFAPFDASGADGVGPPELSTCNSRNGTSKWASSWRPANLAFMTEALSVPYLHEKLAMALPKLEPHERHLGDQILGKLGSDPKEVARRISLLVTD